MDVFFIEAVVAEIRPRISGASIKKVHQPDADTLILRLWTGRRELQLRISTAVGASGVYLTTQPWINPARPLRFCQLLRARLGGLRGVQQLPGERIVEFTFVGRCGGTCLLIAELYGRRPNLLLCDADRRIIDVLHRREGQGGRPASLPGEIWSPPQATARLSLEQLAQEPVSAPPESLAAWLQKEVSPMSPLMARELACRVAQGAAVGEVLQTFAQQWRAGDYAFVGADLDGVPRLFAFYPQALGLEHVRKYPSASAAADCLLGDDAAWGRGGERPRLRKVVQRALARLDRRMQRLEGDRAACKGADEAQQLGELLTANLHRVRKGMSRIEVENYYRQGTVVSIDLDPALPPAANADRLFSRSRKLRRAEEHIARRKQQSADEKQWLEALLLDIGEAESAEALAAVAEEMRSYGLLPREASKEVRCGKGPKPGLRRACSPGGYTLVWGKNNRANDDLVKHVCRPRDLWFHALGVPGSHLVLKRDSQAGEVSEADILYAASLAAGFSRAANEEWVEVMVAEGRQVRKVKGALPGLVQVARYRTVRVAPSREV